VYATVRIYDAAAGLAEAVADNRAEILAIFERIPGFRGYHILTTGPESAVSITIFDDEAGAEASNRAARDWIAANLADLSVSAPRVLTGDVAMSSLT
jgi:heme-degrading monooxygenase HmoA